MICDFLVRGSWIAVVLVHVSFGMHCGGSLVDKGNSCLVSCPSSWDDRSYSYGHQLYPSDKAVYNVCLMLVYDCIAILKRVLYAIKIINRLYKFTHHGMACGYVLFPNTR